MLKFEVKVAEIWSIAEIKGHHQQLNINKKKKKSKTQME